MIPSLVMRLRTGGLLPWTPNYLATPAAYWLDDQSTLTTGTGVSSQSNRGSLGGAAGQSTGGSQPASVGSGVSRTIRYDGTDDCFFDNSAGARGIAQNAPGGFAFCVLKRSALDGSPTQRNLFCLTNNAGSSRFLCGMSTVAVGAANKPYLAVRRADADSEGLLTAAAATPDTNFHMYLWTIDFASRTGRIWLDGTNTDTSAATLTTAGSLSSNTASDRALTIAAYPNATGANPAANGFSNMEIAALLSGGFAPNSTDIDKLFGWAAWRYGLVSLLPGGHAYKTAAPTV